MSGCRRNFVLNGSIIRKLLIGKRPRAYMATGADADRSAKNEQKTI
jgi:hypothetical protein